MDLGKEVCAIFFDLRKAFDYRSLLEILKASCMNEYILSWLFSYLDLEGRKQSVVLDGKTSTIPVLSGIPQGSVLGPLLFLIYINDAASEQLNPGSYITMYADDLLLHREISCFEDYLTLQHDVNNIANWVDVNRLTLNSTSIMFALCVLIHRTSKGHADTDVHFQ